MCQWASLWEWGQRQHSSSPSDQVHHEGGTEIPIDPIGVSGPHDKLCIGHSTPTSGAAGVHALLRRSVSPGGCVFALAETQLHPGLRAGGGGEGGICWEVSWPRRRVGMPSTTNWRGESWDLFLWPLPFVKAVLGRASRGSQSRAARRGLRVHCSGGMYVCTERENESVREAGRSRKASFFTCEFTFGRGARGRRYGSVGR